MQYWNYISCVNIASNYTNVSLHIIIKLNSNPKANYPVYKKSP